MILKKNRSFVERQVFLNEIIYSKNTVAKDAFRSGRGFGAASPSGAEDI